MSTATNILDHILHLIPTGALEQSAQDFRKLGFNVIRGGNHLDGLTENYQIVLSDGIYIELISYLRPLESYPPGPERRKREASRWSKGAPGWVDFSFLGSILSNRRRTADLVNDRAGRKLYSTEEITGSRQRPDGVLVKWRLNNPPLERQGLLPFYTEDVTKHIARVPSDPPSNISHPNTALGIAHILVFVTATASDVKALVQEATFVAGQPPKVSGNRYEWVLTTYVGKSPRLILEVETANDLTDGPILEIDEVGIAVKNIPKGGEVSNTPFSKIVWVKV